ncbi:hypothetical protein CR152_24375 [Massilia violaceinigra]|uniref:Uncharacterized protein n=1 Tax=Massilia violaceinigra TaxID=2045208 RepID=A0A2D2DQQ0_9BURK|nr:hypothetical protein CR152_24375 [Massilia violaceinigra]
MLLAAIETVAAATLLVRHVRQAGRASLATLSDAAYRKAEFDFRTHAANAGSAPAAPAVHRSGAAGSAGDR